MMTKKKIWDFVGDDDADYTDYEAWIPDANEFGICVRVTINDRRKKAYFTATVSHIDGGSGLFGRDFPPAEGKLNYGVAVQMTNHKPRKR